MSKTIGITESDCEAEEMEDGSLFTEHRIKYICISGRRMVIRLELSNDQDPHNYDPTVDIQLDRAIQPAL